MLLRLWESDILPRKIMVVDVNLWHLLQVLDLGTKTAL
jgi:hypothetical protein